MDRGTKSYLLLHYLLMIGIILLLVDFGEDLGIGIPLWAGILIALGIGLLYPRAVAAIGIAPEGWE